MKTWYALSCPVCGFRHVLPKFSTALTPIAYPAQVVTGGGRACGFKVAQRIAWANLPSLDPSSALMRAIDSEYLRLAEAYDRFYFHLGYLSPAMKALIESMREEIFQLRAQIDMLSNRADRLQLVNAIKRGDQVGENERIFNRIERREQQEVAGRRELLKGLHSKTRNRSDQRGVG